MATPGREHGESVLPWARQDGGHRQAGVGSKFRPKFPPPSLPLKVVEDGDGVEREEGPRVLLRVKRRREDPPLEMILVEGKEEPKRASIMSAMRSLSMSGKGKAGKRARLFRLLDSEPKQDAGAETTSDMGGERHVVSEGESGATTSPQKAGGTVVRVRGNAKKADEERLSAEAASLRRRDRALAVLKAARSSDIVSRRDGLDPEGRVKKQGTERSGVRVVDVDVGGKRQPVTSPPGASSQNTSGNKARVFDECEESPSGDKETGKDVIAPHVAV